MAPENFQLFASPRSRTIGPHLVTIIDSRHPDRRPPPIPTYSGALWLQRHDLAKRASELAISRFSISRRKKLTLPSSLLHINIHTHVTYILSLGFFLGSPCDSEVKPSGLKNIMIDTHAASPCCFEFERESYERYVRRIRGILRSQVLSLKRVTQWIDDASNAFADDMDTRCVT